MNSIYFYETSIGRIGIADNGEAVTGLMFAGRAGAGYGETDADTGGHDAGPGGHNVGPSGHDACPGGDDAGPGGDGAGPGGHDAGPGGDGAGPGGHNVGPGSDDVCPAGFALSETALIKEAAKQLNEYLEGNRKVFDIPLELEGTPFQKLVWKALQDIPYSETRSYREIAESIGRPKACRAVGMANNKNPVAIFVPCHRVIGSDGKLVGYAGGMDIKEKLLDLEKQMMKK